MYRISLAAALTVLALLTACTKASEKAEREYQLLLKGGATLEERCAKRREIAAAYLKEEDEQNYPLAKITADVECQRVTVRNLRR